MNFSGILNLKIWNGMKCCKYLLLLTCFGNLTISTVSGNDIQRFLNMPWVKEVKDWEPSITLKVDLPAHLAGFSYDGDPVYIVQYGRWEIVKYVGNTPENNDRFYNRIKKLLRVMIEELVALKSSEAIIILDGKYMSFRQLTSFGAFEAHLTLMRYLDQLAPIISRFIIINASYVSKAWLEGVRPVAGAVIGKAEVVRSRMEETSAFLSTIMATTNVTREYGGPAEVPLKIY